MIRNRKLSISILVILVLGVVVFFFRGPIGLQLFILTIKPSKVFDKTPIPAKPDYSIKVNWAALPDKEDKADLFPASGTGDLQGSARVDVFYIHPTTFVKSSGWNQTLTDEEVNKRTDNFCMMNQASAFNFSGKVYAPRYRQATLYSFLDKEGEGKKALELAYQDVKDAFEYFLNHYNEGRPIILAGHSQGTRHGLRLLKDYFSGKPLQKQLVAAYLIGQEITQKYLSTIPDIPVCESPDQTQCLITWNTEAVDADVSLVADKTSVCVNPLTWKIDDQLADRSLNLGGVSFKEDEQTPPVPDVGVVSADCTDGKLFISIPNVEGYDYMPFGKNNYHYYDIHLFYMNMRKNAQDRATAFLRQ